jgi:hypothetical protein
MYTHISRGVGMPLYRTGQARFAKWRRKYDPATVSARFAQVADVAEARAQEGLTTFASVQELVRGILDVHGINGPDRGKYLGFANKLLSHSLRAKDEAAVKLAQGLKQYYVTAFAADPTILDEIIQVVTGWVPPY